MKTYRAVLFDLDGTLVDSNDLQAQAWKEALFDRGYYVPLQKIRKFAGTPSDILAPTLTGLEPGSPEIKALKSYRAGVWQSRYLSRVRPFPHVRTLLERMREEDLRIGVITTATKEEVDGLLRVSGVADLMQYGIHTPSELAGRANEPIVIIGDSAYDIECGKLLGFDVIALRAGGALDAQLAGAVAIYDDPMDLLEHFATSPLGAGRRGYRN